MRTESYCAIFTLIGKDTYQTLVNLLSPRKPNEVKYIKIPAELTKHFAPTPIEIAEVYRFYRQKQPESEKASQYQRFDS